MIRSLLLQYIPEFYKYFIYLSFKYMHPSNQISIFLHFNNLSNIHSNKIYESNLMLYMWLMFNIIQHSKAN